MPKIHGPQGRHKLPDEIVDYLKYTIRREKRLIAPVLVKRVQKRFGVKPNPRSIDRYHFFFTRLFSKDVTSYLDRQYYICNCRSINVMSRLEKCVHENVMF